MSHRRPDGSLSKGGFCQWCGAPSFPWEHSREDRDTGVCNGDIELVMDLRRANPDSGGDKPHFTYKQKVQA